MREIVEEAVFRLMGYQVEEELGRGGGGTVYRCSRSCFGIRHGSAVKATILKWTGIPGDKEFNMDADVAAAAAEDRRRAYMEGELRRKLSEVEALQSLRGKPGIIGIEDYEAGETAEGDWILLVRMELGRGIDLSGLCRNKTEKRLEFLISILEGLACCHEKGILHGDIKPANILEVDGAYKLIDFNISGPACGEAGADGCSWGDRPLMGTPDFAPPELLQKGLRGCFTDVYAVGMLAYLLFNEGAAPEEKVRMRGEGLELPRFAGKGLGEMILKALHRDPNKRYADGRAFLEALKESIRREQRQEVAVLAGQIGQKDPRRLNWGNVWNGGFICRVGEHCYISDQARGGLYRQEGRGGWKKIAEGHYVSLNAAEGSLFCLDEEGRLRSFGSGEVVDRETYKYLLAGYGGLIGRKEKGGGPEFACVEAFFRPIFCDNVVFHVGSRFANGLFCHSEQVGCSYRLLDKGIRNFNIIGENCIVIDELGGALCYELDALRKCFEEFMISGAAAEPTPYRRLEARRSNGFERVCGMDGAAYLQDEAGMVYRFHDGFLEEQVYAENLEP